MRIQDLAIIFLIIILPISLVIATYTQYQIQTINTQTLYDNKLTSATYDAIRAFQINTRENKLSGLVNSKVRDLEASVSTFRNSIMSTFELDGYSEDDLNSYIPALVYTLYDGFYIYSPYENVNYRHDDSGNPTDHNGENIYGLKPYISYSCRYIYPNKEHPTIDVVITYALDNHVTVRGMINGEYVNKDGYLIDNIDYDEATGKVVYNGVQITEEHTKEHIPLTDNGIYSYAKIQGTTYYLDETNERIIARLNENTLTVQCERSKDPETYNQYYQLITNNRLSKDYYIDAYNFTEWFKNTELVNLTYADTYDTVIIENADNEANNGNVIPNEQVWNNNNNTAIFQFNSTMDYTRNIENELSSFNQHRLAVIRHKIEVNLAIAIANYNEYSGANNVFQMPDLKEDEWDYITHNISLISFLQGLPIGGKIYNGYSIVTNSESEEVVCEQNIYILGYNTINNKYEYCRIGDNGIKDGTVEINSGSYAGNSDNYTSAGRLNLAFKRDILTNDIGTTYYYYPLQDYYASYNSIVMQNDVDTYDDIYAYVNGQSDELKKAFYTALGRERASTYKLWSNYIVNIGQEDEIPSVKPSEIFDRAGTNPDGLHIGDFVNYDAGTWTAGEISSIKTGLKTDLQTANGSKGLPRNAFQFGGFTAGSSRNGNATPHNYYSSKYNYVKDASTNNAVTGWRVFDIDGDNVTLISAGNPEDYYSPYGTNYGYASEYILTGNVNSSWSTGETDKENYQKRDWGVYVNGAQKATSATPLTKSRLDSWYTKYIDTANANTYMSTTFQKIYSEPYIKYQNIIDNYSYYWLPAVRYSSSTSDFSYVTPHYRYLNRDDSMAFGVRLLVTLSSDVQFIEEKTGTKTIFGGNMYSYGGGIQTYNCWDIAN